MMATAMVPPGPAPGFAKNPDKLLDFEPSPRRVRISFNGKTIVDSTRAMLMREGGHVPIYYLPMDDVAMEFSRRPIMRLIAAIRAMPPTGL
jgi:uncharacterized protein (DUF427 family)